MANPGEWGGGWGFDDSGDEDTEGQRVRGWCAIIRDSAIHFTHASSSLRLVQPFVHAMHQCKGMYDSVGLIDAPQRATQIPSNKLLNTKSS